MTSPDRSPRIRKVCDIRICPTAKDCQLSSAIGNIKKSDSPFTDDEKRWQLEALRNNSGFQKCRLYSQVFPINEITRLRNSK
jgi:hypothetical protein